MPAGLLAGAAFVDNAFHVCRAARCGTDVIEQTTLFGSKLVATWRVSELGR